MNAQQQAPVDQQTIIDRCYHPTGTWREFPESALEGSLVTRFEEMVVRYPNRLAVKSRAYALSYAQLNAAANCVAQQLLTNLSSETRPIIIYCHHGVAALVAALGVLKSGNFYVCLDTQHPTAVNQQIISHTEPACILTEQETLNSAQHLTSPTLRVFTVDPEAELAWAVKNPGRDISATDLAYITFTSGTTGAPKGVIEDHRDVLAYCRLFVNTFHLCPEDRVLAVTHVSTGGAWVSIFPSLLSGGSVFLFDVHREGIAPLADWIGQVQITAMAMAASLFRELAPLLPPPQKLAGLRLLGLGGEALHTRDFKLYREHCPDSTILRIAFGCTEAHFISYHFWDKASPLPQGPTPVGYPAGDAEILILNGDGDAVAAGEAGEIAVRRAHLSVGYWRDPELTAARYPVDIGRPQSNSAAKRLFLLGDRGYKQADGCLVHLGRIDDRAKIRGHFVNLDAFERTLAQLDGVVQAAAVVVQNEQADAALIAYLQLQPESNATVSSLYQQLAHQQPRHLIPRSIILVDRMPLTRSGKIDRRALPPPETQRPELATPYRAPSTALEEQIAAVWQEVLAVAPIGVDDNFLELGGDSLRAMLVMNRLHTRFSRFIHVRHFFEASTIAAFSNFLTRHYPEVVRQLTGNAVDAPADSSGAQTQRPEKLDQTAVQEIRTWLTAFQRPVASGTAGDPGEHTKNPSALFLLSAPRSGSTLLRVLLAGHPQLFAPPEMALLNFNTLQERYTALSAIGAGEYGGALRAIMAAKECDGATAQKLMQQLEAQNLSTQAFYQQLQRWIHPRLLVDKTPGYAYDLETLHQAEAAFDVPRYVHLVRHPYGMIHSHVEGKSALGLLARVRRQSPNLGLPPVTEDLPIGMELVAAAIWLIVEQNINTFLATIPAQRQLLVHFEQLVQEPAAVMERVCTFLKIPLDPAMLQPYADPSKRMTDGIHALNLMAGDHKFNQHRQIDPSVADRWRTHYQKDFLSDEVWEIAEQLGYNRQAIPNAGNLEGAFKTYAADSTLDGLLHDLKKLPFDEAQSLLRDSEHPNQFAQPQE